MRLQTRDFPLTQPARDVNGTRLSLQAAQAEGPICLGGTTALLPRRRRAFIGEPGEKDAVRRRK